MNLAETPSIEPRRDQAMLVVQHGTTLPQRCPICNAPAAAETTLHFGTWHVDYSLVTVHLFLCGTHTSKYRAARRLAGALVVGGLVGMIVSFACRLPAAVIVVCFAAILAGLVWLLGALSGHLQLFLKGRRYDAHDRLAWISGMCPEFLAAFPDRDR
jgi:hypothetical protein